MADDTPELQQTDHIDPARIAALNVVLGMPGDTPHPFCHQVFFWDPQPAAELGRDGHPRTGGFIPDFGLPRRMWAGGQLRFNGSLKPGRSATKRTRLVDAERKEGQSGPLAVVTLSHEVLQDGKLCVEDRQDLIYRAEAVPGAPASAPLPAPRGETVNKRRGFTTTELFRYSALTFNGHRIHYDRDYAREIEGYPGLVVHGPLLAQHLILIAESELGQLATFKFRARAPLFDFEEAVFCAKLGELGLEMWVKAGDGRLIMEASAE